MDGRGTVSSRRADFSGEHTGFWEWSAVSFEEREGKQKQTCAMDKVFNKAYF